MPKPHKRGIADAVRRLYNGKSLLKYDTASKGYRFGDILNLVHAAPDPGKPWQGDLFQYALDRRHHPDTAVVPKSLPVLAAHRDLMALWPAKRRKVVTGARGVQRLADAGMTWEALAGWLQGPMDKAAWEQATYSHYGDPTEQVPERIPVYTWNLAGYRAGHGPSGKGNRHTFGGLSDAAFRMVPLLEGARDADWPWVA